MPLHLRVVLDSYGLILSDRQAFTLSDYNRHCWGGGGGRDLETFLIFCKSFIQLCVVYISHMYIKSEHIKRMRNHSVNFMGEGDLCLSYCFVE